MTGQIDTFYTFQDSFQDSSGPPPVLLARGLWTEADGSWITYSLWYSRSEPLHPYLLIKETLPPFGMSTKTVLLGHGFFSSILGRFCWIFRKNTTCSTVELDKHAPNHMLEYGSPEDFMKMMELHYGCRIHSAG